MLREMYAFDALDGVNLSMINSPPTPTGAGYQRTIPTSKGHI